MSFIIQAYLMPEYFFAFTAFQVNLIGFSLSKWSDVQYLEQVQVYEVFIFCARWINHFIS